MTALFKDYLRTIKNTLSRFISIALIVAIGAGFYAGLKSAGPDMRLTADKYYEETGLMDLKVTGNYGLDDTDIELISEISGVMKVTFGYALDALDQKNGTNIHIMSVPDLKNGLNTPTLISGEYPKNADECVIDSTGLKSLYKIGDEIELFLKEEDINERLETNKLKVVGTVVSPLYIGKGRGTSTVGNGNSDGFIMTSNDLFKSNYYDEAFVKYQPPIEDIDYSEYDYSKSEDENEAVVRAAHSTFSDRYKEYMETNRIMLDISLIQKRQERHERMVEEIGQKIKEAETAHKVSLEELKKSENHQIDVEIERDEILKVVAISQKELDEKQSSLDAQLALVAEKEDIVTNTDGIIAEIDGLISQSSKDLQNKRAIIEQKKEELQTYIAVHSIASGEPNDPDADSFREEIERLEYEYDESVIDHEIFKAQQEQIKIKTRQAEVELIADKEEAVRLKEDLNTAIETHDNREVSVKKAEAKVTDAKKDVAVKKLNVGEKEKVIKETNEELVRLERIFYFVTDRRKNPNYEEYGENSARIDAIASVFPVFFVLVAALVCLTGMTRLVEEQTGLIGTYKALGYSNSKIIGKYVFYALLATLIGAVLGLIIGFTFVPQVIIGAYGRLYSIPSPSTPIRLDYTLVVILVALIANLIATVVAAYGELKLPASELMRPKAPKKGKRIFLERFKFIWTKMSFSAKITARNVFRYKRRMLMTILGIAGCAALLLTGLALRNSLTDIVDLQYEEIFHYDMKISVDEKLNQTEMEDLDNILKGSEAIAHTYEQSSLIMNNADSYYVESDYGNENQVQASVFVASSESNINEFITFRDRKTGKDLEFDEESVIITEKLADLLNLKIHDQLLIEPSDGRRYIASITGITENYTDHYVYMGDFIYNQYFPEVSEYTNIMVKVKDKTGIDSIAEELNTREFVQFATLARNERVEYEDMVESLNLIVYLLIMSAGLLAFVVLYNLTSINVAERKRELSTIKVLGFYDEELTSYIGRENIVLTVFGVILGLIAGAFLGKYVVITAEVESLMFGRNIKVLSYFIAAGLTLLFTLIVNIIMHFQLKKINMLDATKSFE